MAVLDAGTTLPTVSLTTTQGDLVLPDALAGSFGVVLVYRGAWCPYCNAQLASFRRASEQLEEAGIKVVALSVDDEATTKELVAKHKLPFPVGFGADAEAIHEALGSFVNEEPRYLQSTGFVLSPEGTVLVSVYSSGAIGRLVPEDVIGMVKYVKSGAGH